jgi:hypothetical protein
VPAVASTTCTGYRTDGLVLIFDDAAFQDPVVVF